MMTLFFRIALSLTLSFAVLFLTGCATVSSGTLGIPQAEWDQYSPEKQDQLRTAYQQTQARKKAMSAKAGRGTLTVNIQGGQALLPPYSNLTAYQPISFTLRQGECDKKIPVVATGDSAQKGRLTVCYADDTLFMDPSPYEPALSRGAMQFPYMPAWQRGFTYPGVTSTGLLKLTNVDVTVKQAASADDNR